MPEEDSNVRQRNRRIAAENAEDRQLLLENEQQQPLDNDFGDIVTDEQNEYVGNAFVPAISPERIDNSSFRNVQLTNTTDLLAEESPPDGLNFTYLVFYILGTATMTPWNFFVTAEDYWMYKFRNTTLNDTNIESELTPMQKSFTCDLTLTASISGGIFLILNAIYGHHFSHKAKMFITLTIILIIFIITTAFVEVNTDHWQEQFFLITLFTVVIINTSSAVMSGVTFSIASLFPPKYMTAVVSGQALGGIFTAIVFILVLAADAPPNTTAFIYFIIGSVLIVLALVTYAIMRRQAFFRYHVDGIPAKLDIIYNTPSTSQCVSGVEKTIGVALEPNLREVFDKIYVHVVAISLLFATSLSVYPAVTVLMQSEHKGEGHAWNDIYYMPVVNYLFFNTGDYIGRILAGFFEVPNNPHTLLLLAFVRIFFLPMFLCSNTHLHQFLPTVVHSDVTFMIMILAFAISNGYVANLLLLLAPRTCMQHEKEIATSIMIAALNCGLVLGSMMSMIFVQLL